MSILNKIKGILFDEEVEIPVIKEEKKEEIKQPFKEELPKIKEEVKEETIPERELFNSSRTFNFPENDFEKPSRNLNVLDYEKRQPKRDKLNIFSRPEKSENKPFKPSPVISPVYGIIDPDKDIAPIKSSATPKPRSTGPIDIDEVRKKAYGTLEDDIESTLDKSTVDFYKEEPMENKSIEELLVNDVDVTDDIELRSTKRKLDLLDEIDENLDRVTENTDKLKEINPDDTLESDLFNLIDSMYEKRKDGDE